jgi:hypothetical protein
MVEEILGGKPLLAHVPCVAATRGALVRRPLHSDPPRV